MIPTKKCRECHGQFELIDITGRGNYHDYTEGLCDPCHEADLAKRDEMKRIEAAKKHAINIIPKTYFATDTMHPDFPVKIHRMAQEWAKQNDRKIWFGLIGAAGKGKTRVLAMLAKRLIFQGQRAAWVNATQWQWCCQYEFDDTRGYEAKAHLDRYRKAELLIFDDLGKQKWTEAQEAKFYDMLERRGMDELTLLWSSNSSLEELTQKMSKDRGLPITDRLAGYSKIIAL